MGWLVLVFDALLAAALIWLAWQATHTPGLFRSVISFIVFGLLMALAWVRLEAPDIALAEAAIGAGATGALLLSALGRLTVTHEHGGSWRERRRDLYFWIPAGGGLLGLLTLAAWALPSPGLGEQVQEALPDSGVENPVTAVLLNFRAFDTLLEIGVLLLAAIAIWSMGRMPLPTVPSVQSPALPALGRVLFPMFVLISVYLLWRGSHAPGGAFPAGAVMGAGGILSILAGAQPWLTGRVHGPWRVLLSLGFAAMLAVALGVLLLGQPFFAYPPGLAGMIVLALELAAGLSIAMSLVALYLAGQPPDRWEEAGSG